MRVCVFVCVSIGENKLRWKIFPKKQSPNLQCLRVVYTGTQRTKSGAGCPCIPWASRVASCPMEGG